MPTILVTGGAGYIGSHVCKTLKEAGHEPVTFDNLSHGHRWAVRFGPFLQGDILNPEDLDRAFSKYRPEAVIHLAGSIDLRESVVNPSKHYTNNVVGSLCLLNAMVRHQVRTVVFSSSAAIYAPPQCLPIDENHLKAPLSPYGKSKWMIEQLLEDFQAAHGLIGICLRYFNAAGADLEGMIGEAHNPETHLIPKTILAAQTKGNLAIYNSSLPTSDGTALRDYVHVCDLAAAHVRALQWAQQHDKSDVFNLGTGRGYSVREIIAEVERIGDCTIPITVQNRELSEVPSLIADASKAKEELNWSPIHSDLATIIETAWNWHSNSVFVKK